MLNGFTGYRFTLKFTNFQCFSRSKEAFSRDLRRDEAGSQGLLPLQGSSGPLRAKQWRSKHMQGTFTLLRTHWPSSSSLSILTQITPHSLWGKSGSITFFCIECERFNGSDQNISLQIILVGFSIHIVDKPQATFVMILKKYISSCCILPAFNLSTFWWEGQGDYDRGCCKYQIPRDRAYERPLPITL